MPAFMEVKNEDEAVELLQYLKKTTGWDTKVAVVGYAYEVAYKVVSTFGKGWYFEVDKYEQLMSKQTIKVTALKTNTARSFVKQFDIVVMVDEGMPSDLHTWVKS